MLKMPNRKQAFSENIGRRFMLIPYGTTTEYQATLKSVYEKGKQLYCKIKVEGVGIHDALATNDLLKQIKRKGRFI